MELLQLAILGVLAWGVHDLINYLRNNKVKIIMNTDDINPTQEDAAPQEAHEEVVLDRYVPNVTNWDDLNELLVSIGAAVILTQDKVLEDVGHDPKLWRKLGDTDSAGTFK